MTTDYACAEEVGKRGLGMSFTDVAAARMDSEGSLEVKGAPFRQCTSIQASSSMPLILGSHLSLVLFRLHS